MNGTRETPAADVGRGTPSRRRRLARAVLIAGVPAALIAAITFGIPPVRVPCVETDVSDMVRVPGGPLRRVVPGGGVIDVPACFIDRFEVTVGHYETFLSATGHPPPHAWEGQRGVPGTDSLRAREDFPVVHVRQGDAVAFSRYRMKRLPTDEEWERAARGTGPGSYPWGDGFAPRMSNSLDLGLVPPRVIRVGFFESGRSPFGAYDMVGNVREWTGTLTRDELDDRFVIRGGSFLTPVRESLRRDLESVTFAHDLGFRCAVSETHLGIQRQTGRLAARLGFRDPLRSLLIAGPAERALVDLARRHPDRVETDIAPVLRHAVRWVRAEAVAERLERTLRAVLAAAPASNPATVGR